MSNNSQQSTAETSTMFITNAIQGLKNTTANAIRNTNNQTLIPILFNPTFQFINNPRSNSPVESYIRANKAGPNPNPELCYLRSHHVCENPQGS